MLYMEASLGVMVVLLFYIEASWDMGGDGSVVVVDKGLGGVNNQVVVVECRWRPRWCCC